MNSYEKEELLEKYQYCKKLTNRQVEVLKKYIEDNDIFVRIKVAEILLNFKNNESKELLLKLACDKEELVRIEAYESLSFFESQDVEKFLKKAFVNERRSLACAYAIYSWADVIKERRGKKRQQLFFIKRFIKKSRIQKSEQCLLSCYYAEYVIGEQKSLKKIINFLNSENYQVRCATLDVLAGILNIQNKNIIKKVVEKLIMKEKSRAVKIRAEKFLKSLQ